MTATKPAATLRQAVPFFWVTDMERSLRFYEGGLGFAVKRRWIDDGRLRWCWLERDGAALMLQEYARDGRHAGRPDGVPLGEGVALYFICDDALAFYREIAARSVAASTPTVGNAMWVTELTDPDGYRLAFESPTDAPEDSVYREAAA